jgi:8-oxo-dGTP pyrophosphatase MutT (NUDIX family)
MPVAARTHITLVSVVDALGRAGRLLVDGEPPAGLPAEVVVDAPVAGPPSAPAAVLVALFEEAGETRVVLTKRATTLRSHRGQISFPGGRIDPGEGAVAAALREALEEVALDPQTVQPLGVLRPAVSIESGTAITPVVGSLAARPHLVASPAEVERVFDVALADLAGSFREEQWTQPGSGTYAVHFFDVAGETVWGATARMLVDLLTTVLVAT